jgi:uncharacterized protein YyaL (SSP411 family)
MPVGLLARAVLLLGAMIGLAAAAPAADPKDKDNEKGKPNRLARESSPYLLQHARNPVDWYPWGQEAFDRARKEKKLVFLSIGYSSCHWCHVMERESFANPDVAKILNAHFVCIKVDREERPDVDEVYMTAIQVYGEQGGWPLSMFLTADGKPIFGGTYFPPEDRKLDEGTIVGFKTILKKVVELHTKDPDGLLKQADVIAERTVDALERSSLGVAIVALNRELVKDAAGAYEFDPVHGGTGSKIRDFRGTKFPRVSVWSFLLQQSRKPGNEELAKAVKLTLRQMAEGGIYDQLGGGFHRYSTERTWTVPHFEKMLYDNAQLVELYADAYKLDPNPLYKRVIDETLAFVRREMTGPDGAFYSALDADTNHKEGEFYVWTAAEIKDVLGNEADAAFLRTVYGVGAPNFEEKFHVLRLPKPTAEIAKDLKMNEPELLARLEPLKKKLFDHRAKRERPFLDTKVIAAWNGQMIAAYARAGEALQEQGYTAAAARAAEFLLKTMRDKDGRLLRIYGAAPGAKPAAKGNGFLDDYAFLLHGLLNLHDATGDKRWLDEAKALADGMLKWYADEKRGGFYHTAQDHEKLFARSKESYDGAQPAGNSVAARDLLRLGRKTGDARYTDFGVRTIKAFAATLKASPSTVPGLARALDEHLDATGKDAVEPPKAAPAAPANPRESADVVKAELKADAPAKDGSRSFTVTLTVSSPWHVYANPVGNPTLAEVQTVVEVYLDGKKADATVEYPKGKMAKDTVFGDYAIYEGTVKVTGKLPAGTKAGAALEVRVRLTACNEGTCLLPSVVKLK